MANKRSKHEVKVKAEPTPVETALRPIGLDRQEVSEAFIAESLRPLDDDFGFELRADIIRADVKAGNDGLTAEVTAEDNAGETTDLLYMEQPDQASPTPQKTKAKK